MRPVTDDADRRVSPTSSSRCLDSHSHGQGNGLATGVHPRDLDGVGPNGCLRWDGGAHTIGAVATGHRRSDRRGGGEHEELHHRPGSESGPRHRDATRLRQDQRSIGCERQGRATRPGGLQYPSHSPARDNELPAVWTRIDHHGKYDAVDHERAHAGLEIRGCRGRRRSRSRSRSRRWSRSGWRGCRRGSRARRGRPRRCRGCRCRAGERSVVTRRVPVGVRDSQ